MKLITFGLLLECGFDDLATLLFAAYNSRQFKSKRTTKLHDELFRPIGDWHVILKSQQDEGCSLSQSNKYGEPLVQSAPLRVWAVVRYDYTWDMQNYVGARAHA